MFIENQIPHKKKDEKLLLFLRRHWVYITGHYLFYVLLMLIPVGIYLFLSYNNPRLLSGTTSYPALVLGASVYYLFIVLFFYNTFLDYHLDVWIVTDERIISIEQKGLFNRQISEHSVDKIQDVTAHQKGVLATFLSFGDVHVQTAGEKQYFIFKQVDNPFQVVKVIQELIEKYDSIPDKK